MWPAADASSVVAAVTELLAQPATDLSTALSVEVLAVAPAEVATGVEVALGGDRKAVPAPAPAPDPAADSGGDSEDGEKGTDAQDSGSAILCLFPLFFFLG